jgi:hypothetical protein
MSEKVCSSCHETKSLTLFGLDKSRPGGVSYDCKPCKNTKAQARWKNRTSGWRDVRNSLRRAKMLAPTSDCVQCKETKPKSRFSPDPRRPSGVQSMCRRCAADWQNENPIFRRNGTLKAKYGITQAKYDEMLAAQGGRCAICKGTDFGRKRDSFFAVDHDHATGSVRGLLCRGCNHLLGVAKDSVAILESAIAYLRNRPCV